MEVKGVRLKIVASSKMDVRLNTKVRSKVYTNPKIDAKSKMDTQLNVGIKAAN